MLNNSIRDKINGNTIKNQKNFLVFAGVRNEREFYEREENLCIKDSYRDDRSIVSKEGTCYGEGTLYKSHLHPRGNGCTVVSGLLVLLYES